MNIKPTQTALLVSAFFASSISLADTPNAGSLDRDAKEAVVAIPTAKIEAPQLLSLQDESDNTPLVVKHIHFTGNGRFEQAALDNVVAQAGNIETLGQLRAAMNLVNQFYQDQGYPLVLLNLPPQAVENGEVVVQVLEGKVGELAIENHSRLSDNVVNRYLAAVPLNEVFYQPTAERTLLLMKDLAGTSQISYQFAAGKAESETALSTYLEQAKLINGSIMADNYGSKSTGEWRTRLNLALNSLFGRGEQISLQGMSSFKGVNYGNLGVVMPIGYHGLSLTANVSQTAYDLGGNFKALDATGTAKTAEVGLRYPILRSNENNIWLNMGGDVRRLRDEVRATNTLTDKHLKQAKIGLSASFEKPFGVTRFDWTNQFGKLTIDSADARAIDAVSAKTQGGYYKLNTSLSHTQYLGQRWQLIGSVNFQWANKNLDSAEQLSLGGADGVAGYHSGDLSVDRGAIAQANLRYLVNQYIALDGFYNAGRGNVRAKPYNNDQNRFILHSYGVGVSAQYKGFFVESKLAWHDSTKFNRDRNPRVWVRGGYSF